MKKQLLLVLFIAANFFCKAQTADWLWAETSSGVNNSTALNVATDASGNVYVAGSFGSDSIHISHYKLNNYSNNGTTDIFLVKYDANGNVLWVKNFGGTGSDAPSAIAVDDSANVFLTGSFQSASCYLGAATLTNSTGNFNLFIAKYTTDGTPVWAKGVGGDGNDFSYSLTTDAAGSAYVAGYYSSSTIDFGKGVLTNASTVNGVNVFLAKYNGNGNLSWAQSFGGTTRDFGFSVAVDSRNIYLTGSFGSDTITFGSNQLINIFGAPTLSLFLVKLDTAGSVMWARRGDSRYSVFSKNVATDQGGNIYVSGYFDSDSLILGSTILINNCLEDMFIAKYNTSGNLQWAKNPVTNPSLESVDFSYLTADSLGNTYAAGIFSTDSIRFGSITLVNPSVGGYDLFLVKYNEGGNAIWVQDGFGSASVGSLAADVSGNLYMSGDFGGSNANFGSISLPFTSGTNMFIAKYGAVATGIKPVSATANSLNIFPNPSSGKFIVQLSGVKANELLEVYDVVGRRVYQSTLTNLQAGNFHQLDLSAEAAGVYFVQFKSGENIERQKIVIAK